MEKKDSSSVKRRSEGDDENPMPDPPPPANAAATTSTTANRKTKRSSQAPSFLQKSLQDAPLYAKECDAREKALTNPILLGPINFLATIFIFLFFLVSLEMILSVGLTVGLTFFFYNRLAENPQISAQTLNMTLLSFAVVSPIITLVTIVFKRREEALYSISDLRGTLQQLYVAHAIWDWNQKPGVVDDSGRTRSTVNWLDHSDEAAREIFRLAHDVARFLTLPNSSRARHKVTHWGRKEAARTNDVGAELFQSGLVHLGRLAELCEILKREGIPGNEAARIRQYERFIQIFMEKLRMIKLYRTPQGLRSFGRLFSVILPPFFAPFFAEISVNMETMAFGIVFAVVTSVCLTGLFETVIAIEDPFLRSSRLDGVHVYDELVEGLVPQILVLRQHYFPAAGEFVKSTSKEDEVDDRGRESNADQWFTARLVSGG